MNPRTLSIFLGTLPYGFENTDTVLRLADAALAKGHRVRIFAPADSVYIAGLDQHPDGLPDALAGLTPGELESAHRLRALQTAGASCHYLPGDLAMRGFRPADLPHD